MSETKEPTLEVEHDVLFETFSQVINIGRPNNLDRVGLGRQLAKVYQFVADGFVAERGDSVFVRNQAASRALTYFHKKHRIAPGTARHLMRVAERFGNDHEVLETFSWTELRMLLSYDNAVVQEAMSYKRAYPQITGDDFSLLVKYLRSNSSKSDAQS